MNNTLPLIILIAMATVILITTLILFIYLLKKQARKPRETLQRLIDRWGGEQQAKGLGTQYRYDFTHEGDEAEALFLPQQRSTPPTLYLQLRKPQSLRLTVRKRNIIDRLCAALRLVVPLAPAGGISHDPLWISADRSDRHVQQWLQSADAFNHIARIMEQYGLKAIWHDRYGITAVKVLQSSEQADPDMVYDVLHELKHCSVPMQERIATRPPRSRLRTFPYSPLPALFGIPLGIAILGGAAFFIAALESYPPLYPSLLAVFQRMLPIMAVGITCTIALVFALTHTHSNRHAYLLILFLVSLPAFYLSVCGGYLFSNGLLSRDKPIQPVAARLERTFIKGKGSRQIQFTIDNRPTDSFDCSSSCYKEPPGTPFIIRYRRGYFGIDWLVDYTPEQ